MALTDGIFAEREKCRAAWEQVKTILDRLKFDLSVERPALAGIPVQIFDTRITVALEILASIQPESDSDVSVALIAPKRKEIQKALSNFVNHANQICSQIEPQITSDNLIADSNGNFHFQVTAAGKQVAAIDLGPAFGQLHTAIDTLLTNLAVVVPLCRLDGIQDLAVRNAELSALLDKTRKSAATAADVASAAGTSAGNAELSSKTAKELLDKTSTSSQKAENTLQAIEKDAASVTSLVAQIKTIGAAADELAKQVEGYQSSFGAFQKQLDSRLQQFDKFEKNTEKVVADSAIRDAEIDRLTKLADTMIRGASTAGLSTSLENTRKIYAKRMVWARVGFIVSIVVLTISAIPLAAHLLPGLVGKLIPPMSETAQNSPVGVLGRIILLLPGSWLTLFFSKSFTEFFHLEREYAHKAALAMSTDGFKREAPKYAEEITTSVFAEIMQNPSTHNSPEAAEHPIAALADRIREIIRPKK